MIEQDWFKTYLDEPSMLDKALKVFGSAVILGGLGAILIGASHYFFSNNSPTQQKTNECCICFESFNQVNQMVFDPCGHARTCQECSTKIHDQCPICRELITSKRRIYM